MRQPMAIIQLFYDVEELDDVDMLKNDIHADHLDSIAIDNFSEKNCVDIHHISAAEKNKHLNDLFGSKSEMAKMGAVLVVGQPVLYFEDDFKENYFREKFEQMKKAVENMTLKEFAADSTKYSILFHSISEADNLYVCYDHVLPFDEFVRSMIPDQPYYIGVVKEWDYI